MEEKIKCFEECAWYSKDHRKVCNLSNNEREDITDKVSRNVIVPGITLKTPEGHYLLKEPVQINPGEDDCLYHGIHKPLEIRCSTKLFK